MYDSSILGQERETNKIMLQFFKKSKLKANLVPEILH